jgi:hypothetical protein
MVELWEVYAYMYRLIDPEPIPNHSEQADYLTSIKTSMTRKCQDIGDLKGFLCQNIDYSEYF